MQSRQSESGRIAAPNRIVVASRNAAKVREIHQVLEPSGLEVLSLDDVGFTADIEETGRTFADNAALKALAVAEATGEVVVADDSGLTVDMLGGGPGIHSARYGGEGLTDPERVQLLLEELADVPHHQRTAQFVCALVLARGDQVLATWHGRVAGVISDEPRGSGGFGYDPIFLYVPLGKTFAELAPEHKNALSHRGRAVRRLPKVLQSIGQ